MSDNNDAISLSIEETNKLRASLGLAPLEAEDKPAESSKKRKLQETAASNLPAEQPDAEEVRDRIERARARRHIAELSRRVQEEEDDEEDLDVAAWTEKMRRQEAEAKQAKQKSERHTQQTKSSAVPVKVGHKLKLKEGETITLTMADRHVLDEDESDLVLEDLRTKELTKYAQHNKERAKIKEYLASAGPTGIASRALDSDGEESGEEPEEVIGLRMAPDESMGLRSVNEPEEGQMEETVAPQARTTLVSKFTVTIDPVQKQAEPGVRKLTRKEKIKKRKAINWDEIFDGDEAPVVSQSPQSEPVKLRPFGVIGADLQEDEEENNELYGALLRRMETVKPYEDPRVKEEEALRTLEEIEVKVKEEEAEMTDMSEEPKSAIGVIDEGTTTVKPEFVITSTEEFAKSLQTPLEKLEERKAAATYMKRRGTEVPNLRKRPLETAEKAPIEFTDIPEEVLDERLGVLDEEGIDGGLASALKYIRKKGELTSDKWKLGRVGKEQKLPLHKSTEEQDVKLDYTDNYGNVMNPKQAFRYMSWSFHGKGPGKAKTEKMLKKMELEHKLKTGDPNQVLPTLRALKAQQAKGQAYLVLTTNKDEVKK